MDFLNNTNIVVALGFIVFVGVVLYARVPQLIARQLDARAEAIRADLEEARVLREEAQTILAGYERRQREVSEHAEEIVEAAKHEAEQAAKAAKADIEQSVERRMQTAREQIAAAEQAAIDKVRNRAVNVAIASAAEVIGKQMDAARAGDLIDDAIRDVGQKLH